MNTRIGFNAHLKSIRNGSHKRFLASHTLSTKLAIMPVALMKGKPMLHCNVMARSNKKGCCTAILCRIRQVNVKTDSEFSGDMLHTFTSNNTRQDDGHIIFREIYLIEDVWVLTNHCRNEVKVGGAEGI
jgi:hypothetical protein